MAKTGAWISAFRLRTLPLGISSIIMAGFLAAFYNIFQWDVFILALLTTIFLQILSNLANDYGDSQHGADNAGRIGPTRAVQSGAISSHEMKKGILVFVLLSFTCGLLLLFVSLDQVGFTFLAFLAAGIAAIAAAIKYTAGKNPYGYAGLGDISVFIFFGVVGVLGTFYLQAGYFEPAVLLPGISCGAFAAGVLNVNNLRDLETDRQAGKNTLAVRLGPERGRIYHLLLLTLGWASAVQFVNKNYFSLIQYSFFIVLPLFLVHAMLVYGRRDPKTLDPLLKQLAISTLLFVIIFGLSQLVGKIYD